MVGLVSSSYSENVKTQMNLGYNVRVLRNKYIDKIPQRKIIALFYFIFSEATKQFLSVVLV